MFENFGFDGFLVEGGVHDDVGFRINVLVGFRYRYIVALHPLSTPVAGHAFCRRFQAKRIEVQQAEPRLGHRKAAVVQEETRGHPGVQMIGADVVIVEGQKLRGRATPKEMVGKSQYHRIVELEALCRVDRLAGPGVVGFA